MLNISPLWEQQSSLGMRVPEHCCLQGGASTQAKHTVKQILSFSPLRCTSFLFQPTGSWKIPKLLNCLFRTDKSQSWNWLCKWSWMLDLLVKQDSNPSHPVFVSAKPKIRQWFSPKQLECFCVYFISTFWFPALPSSPHNILSLLLPITASHFQHLNYIHCISHIKRMNLLK